MADTFFGFDTTLDDNNLEDRLDCPLEDDDLGEEEEYDALNDETFGSEATIGDWEKDHEKLAQITESSRPQNQKATNKKVLKNGVNVDIEDNLSHLVLDEKEGIVPRPGVWDSPSLPLSKPQHAPPLPTTLKNVCTVEELERGLIANRPPPGLTKPAQSQQQQQKSDGSILFEALSLNEKLQLNGLPPAPRFPPPGLGIPGPHPALIPPNMRLPHPQFLQNPRLLANQGGNVLRYPLPPHLMLPHGAQRQQLHGVFGGSFPQPPHPNLGPPPFLRAEHGMMPSFPRDPSNHHQHGFQLLGNQRHQNRSFHHNDQPGNHQPFFKNNQYLHHNHNRNNQRPYNYQHPPHTINGTNGSGEYDEYAGLMSNRQKQWLINIQLLQLNTNHPYVDDYYYIMFSDRQNKKNENPDQRDSKDKTHYNNNGFHRDSRDRDQSQHVRTKVYTPLQFENSLGKLQCSSVTAPRKIIDMDVVSNSESQSTTVMQQKDTKKTRQLLLEIERLYTIQLKLEDLSNPLALLNEQQQQQQQQETESEANVVKKTGPELISSMFTSLLQLIQDDKFAGMLSIRKGKMLLLRFLPCVDVKEYGEQLTELWVGILRGLAIIGRRDSHLIPSFYPEFGNWLGTITDFNIVLRLARALSECIGLPSKNNSLVFALSNKFGISAVASLITQAEKLYPTEESSTEEWSTFILAVVQIVEDSLPDIEPYDPIAMQTLERHLKRISRLKAERYGVLTNLLCDHPVA